MSKIKRQSSPQLNLQIDTLKTKILEKGQTILVRENLCPYFHPLSIQPLTIRTMSNEVLEANNGLNYEESSVETNQLEVVLEQLTIEHLIRSSELQPYAKLTRRERRNAIEALMHLRLEKEESIEDCLSALEQLSPSSKLTICSISIGIMGFIAIAIGLPLWIVVLH